MLSPHDLTKAPREACYLSIKPCRGAAGNLEALDWESPPQVARYGRSPANLLGVVERRRPFRAETVLSGSLACLLYAGEACKAGEMLLEALECCRKARGGRG